MAPPASHRQQVSVSHQLVQLAGQLEGLDGRSGQLEVAAVETLDEHHQLLSAADSLHAQLLEIVLRHRHEHCQIDLFVPEQLWKAESEAVRALIFPGRLLPGDPADTNH